MQTHRASPRRAIALFTVGIVAVSLLAYQAGKIHGERGTLPIPDEDDATLRSEAVARLVQEAGGLHDSHPDPDVTRILLPGVDRSRKKVTTNRFGLRDADWELPKPPGTVRIAVVGDSYVYGFGVEAHERMGSVLERLVREHARGFDGAIEVVHIGVPSWNVLTETTYLRRQLTALAPDLVVLISLPNDLEATKGVRGFGVQTTHSGQERHRADALVSLAWPARRMGVKRAGLVRTGLDYESQHRYRALGEQLRRLSDALADRGTPFRAAFNYRPYLPLVRRFVAPALPEGEVVYIADSFAAEPRYWNTATDSHWNAIGHQQIGRMIYGLMTRDDLLPELDLPRLEEADAAMHDIADAGLAESRAEPSPERLLHWSGAKRVLPGLRFDALSEDMAAQVHTGLDRQGTASPFVSVILDGEKARTLSLAGRGLDRRELAGLEITLSVDGILAGSAVLEAGQPFSLELPLPEGLEARRYRTVWIESSDWGYGGAELRNCISFELERIALVR